MTNRKSKKKASKPKQRRQTKPPAGAPRVELREFLDSVHEYHLAEKAAGTPQGACLLTDPQTGQSSCTLTDPVTCKSLGGKFIGGPCGG